MDATRAAGFCEELRMAVERQPWADFSPGLQVTISVGLASRHDESTVQALLGHADACLYRAKHLGRNRVVSRQPMP
jgi:diguanylate cyclase (GGDEF)-like protein